MMIQDYCRKRELDHCLIFSDQSVADIRTSVLFKILNIWGYSSVGRAPALQAGGQEFESLYLHHFRGYNYIASILLGLVAQFG